MMITILEVNENSKEVIQQIELEKDIKVREVLNYYERLLRENRICFLDRYINPRNIHEVTYYDCLFEGITITFCTFVCDTYGEVIGVNIKDREFDIAENGIFVSKDFNSVYKFIDKELVKASRRRG